MRFSQSAKLRIAIFAAAALARLAFLALWKTKNLVAVFPNDSYPDIALFWLGWGPPASSIIHPPLYSATLAALFWVFGRWRDWAVPILHCLLSAASALLLYSWARKVSSETVALLAAGWMAVDPPLIFFAPQYQSETFFIFLVLWFFVTLYEALSENAGDRPALAAGVWGALTSLCRGTLMAYSPWLALALARMGRWRLLAFLIVGWTAPIFLWTVRNYRYYGEIIPISVQSGWNMYEGFTLDREELKHRPQDMSAEVLRAGLPPGDVIATDRYFQKKIRRWIRENPRAAAKIVFFKIFRFWRPWPYDPYSGRIRMVIGLYFGLLLGLAAYGGWTTRGSALQLLPVYALFLALTLLHSIYFTSLRYRLPLEPFLCFFAAEGLVDILSRFFNIQPAAAGRSRQTASDLSA